MRELISDVSQNDAMSSSILFFSITKVISLLMLKTLEFISTVEYDVSLMVKKLQKLLLQ